MVNIILWILAAVAIGYGVFSLIMRQKVDGYVSYGGESYDQVQKKIKELTARYTKRVKICAVLAVVFILLSQTIVVIKTGYTGVRQTSGQISEEPVPNGFSVKIPFIQSVEPVNNKLQDKLIEEQVWGETTNRTAIWYKNIVVTYRINPEKSAWIFKNVTDYRENLISNSMVNSAVKSASTTLEDAQATNRSSIEPAVREMLQKSVDGKYGADVIEINKIVINEADFEDSYKNAIADKQKAQLAYEKQQIDNQKKIEQAEADAQAKIKESEGEAEANRRLNESISAEVLQKQNLDNQQKMLEKWNGELPKVSGSGTLMDISNIIK